MAARIIPDQKFFSTGTVSLEDIAKPEVKAKALGEVKHREQYVATIKPKSNPQEDREYLNQHATQTKRNPEYHYIHGKAYDLRPFFDKHPGGKDILVMTQGLVDSTPLFESYHAFANRPYIMQQLEKYRVEDAHEDPNDHGLYTFEETGFYRTLTRRVRAEFGATGPDADRMSLTKQTKANWFWVAKISTQMVLSAVFFALTFFSGDRFPVWQQCIFAVLAGNFFIQWGFTVMHDASHFAIAPRNHWANSFFTRVWCAMSLWVCRVWMLHHAVLHHAYTGTPTLDPDLYHALTFVRKHPDTPRSLPLVGIFPAMGRALGVYGWAIASIFLYALVPGMWGGQVLQYLAFSYGISKWKNLWGMTYPQNDAYKPHLFELALMAAHVMAHLYRGSPLVSYVFIVALNISYCMCIVADHDTADAAVLNHVDVDTTPGQGNYGKVDWGRMQVSNSSNFSNHWGNDLFAALNGSINYQIEHHLFPGMSHIHLPRIAPIVRATCEEFNVPYAAYTTLFGAWYSFLVTVKVVMSEEKESEATMAESQADERKMQ